MNAILLAGGRSRRMGRDKATLPLGDVPLVRRVVERVRPCAREVIVVVRGGEPGACPRADAVACPGAAVLASPGVRVVTDVFPGRGPLGGIHAGLLASDAEWNLAVACDLPFASPELATWLRRRAAGHDAAVPVAGGRPEPLHAVYHRNCLSAVEDQLRRGELALARLLARLDVAWVGEEEVSRFGDPARIFLNVNRPGDLERARGLLPEGGGA